MRTKITGIHISVFQKRVQRLTHIWVPLQRFLHASTDTCKVLVADVLIWASVTLVCQTTSTTKRRHMSQQKMKFATSIHINRQCQKQYVLKYCSRKLLCCDYSPRKED